MTLNVRRGLYDPKRLDTDQWLQTASSLGAKYAVLAAWGSR